MEEGRALGRKRGAKGEVEWHGTNLAEASPEEMENVLSDTVLKEFKVRLGRLGIEYQTPARP